MGLAPGGLNLEGGVIRLLLPLDMPVQRPVDGAVVQVGAVAQPRHKIAAETLVVGVSLRQRIQGVDRVGIRVLLRMRGELPPVRPQGLVVRVLGAPNRDGEAQTHKPMGGTCDPWS